MLKVLEYIISVSYTHLDVYKRQIIGAFLVVFSDYIGRNLLSPIIIPIGIVISFVGIPIFIYLIINSKRG